MVYVTGSRKAGDIEKRVVALDGVKAVTNEIAGIQACGRAPPRWRRPRGRASESTVAGFQRKKETARCSNDWHSPPWRLSS